MTEERHRPLSSSRPKWLWIVLAGFPAAYWVAYGRGGGLIVTSFLAGLVGIGLWVALRRDPQRVLIQGLLSTKSGRLLVWKNPYRCPG